MRSLILLFLTLCLCSCAVYVWPHRVQHSPQVTGAVFSVGEPVSGAVVYVHTSLANTQCGPSKLSTSTDSNGAFSFRGRKKIELLLVLGDRVNRWALCIEANGQFYEGWRSIGVGYPPQHASFTCDLEARSQPGHGGEGICRSGT